MVRRRRTLETRASAARGQALLEQRFDAREAFGDAVDAVAIGGDLGAEVAGFAFQLGAEFGA